MAATYTFTAGTTVANGEPYVLMTKDGVRISPQPNFQNSVKLTNSNPVGTGLFVLRLSTGIESFRRSQVTQTGSILVGDLVSDAALEAKLLTLFIKADGNGNSGYVVSPPTVDNSLLRSDLANGIYIEDPNSLMEDSTTNLNPTPFSIFYKKFIQRFTGVAEAWWERVVYRANSGANPDPAGAVARAETNLRVKSLTTSANSYFQTLLDISGQAASAFVGVSTASLGGSVEFSIARGIRILGLGFQPNTRSHTAANDSLAITTQDMTLFIQTGTYTTIATPTHFNCSPDLPAAPLTKQAVDFINNGEGVVIINGNGNEVMYTNYVHYLSTQGSSVRLQYDGTVWRIQNASNANVLTAKYINATNLGETVAAGYTPAKGRLRSAVIKIVEDSSDGDKSSVRILANAGEIVAPFQISDNLRVTFDTYLDQANSIEVEVTTASTSTTEVVAVTFDFEPL